ncbi:hypothetical protein OSB04_005327 [Centaurea solstitialis]|uniref:EF-hand domain-containing protein n=1 Tax=Centaurea solstitialis TaxID=347529 RepID=A0AA38WGC5_9ASTR|nr:hypothetical protein OSB04_005327 [Centaurea solstitialis]
MATTLSTPLPQEQEPMVQDGQVVQSSGSIGPFFAVMSVMMVVAILSCVVGRIYSRRVAEAPLDTVLKRRDCFGWLKGRLWRWPMLGGGGGHVVTLAAKGEGVGERHVSRHDDGAIPCQPETASRGVPFVRSGREWVITLPELAKSMAKMGQPLTYRELTEMIEEADTDGDGVISFNEFARVMARSAAESFGFPVPLP